MPASPLLHALPLALTALELARYALDCGRFGKEASYPMWSSRAWGVALVAGFFVLLVDGSAGWPVGLAIAIGILADLEGIAISLVLPRWQADVPTLWHALRLREAACRG